MCVEGGLEVRNLQGVVLLAVDTKVLNFAQRNGLVLWRSLVRCFVSLLSLAFIVHVSRGAELQFYHIAIFADECQLYLWVGAEGSNFNLTSRDGSVRVNLCIKLMHLLKAIQICKWLTLSVFIEVPWLKPRVLTTTATKGSWNCWFCIWVLTSIPDNQHP